MSKTQSPVPKGPRRPATPLLTIHIHTKTAWGLLAGIAVIAAVALAFHGRAQMPSPLGPQQFAARLPDPGTASISFGGQNSATLPDSNPSFADEAREADAQVDSPAEHEARPVDVRPLNVEPLDIRPVEVKPVETFPARTSNEPLREQASPTPAAADEAGAGPSDLPPDVPDATSVKRPNMGPAILNAAGAAFPYPIYLKWFQDFGERNHGVDIHYQPIGSGGGIRRLQNGEVDFAASDGPPTDQQLAQMKSKILTIPTVLNAAVVTYNIPGVQGEVKFTPEVLAGIYLRQIVSWSDPAIAAVNPGLKLPDQEIVVVHRGEGCIDTYLFTDFLSKVSDRWRETVGKGTAVAWPVGLGAQGDEAVGALVRQTPGAIGYVEWLHASSNKSPMGSVRNQAGRFVAPNMETITAAAASVKDMPADFRVSLTNAPGSSSYPISSFTWLLVPQHFADPIKGRDMFEFLQWMIRDGEGETRVFGYPPLPANVAAKVKQAIAEIR